MKYVNKEEVGKYFQSRSGKKMGAWCKRGCKNNIEHEGGRQRFIKMGGEEIAEAEVRKKELRLYGRMLSPLNKSTTFSIFHGFFLLF